MKISLLISCFLISIIAFGQPNRDELLLVNEESFNMMFQFQHQDSTSISIFLRRENNIDFIEIVNKDCQKDLTINRQIVDNYSLEQFLSFLDEIEIKNFQPEQKVSNPDAKLQVQGSVMIARTHTVNAFVFLYNSDNFNQEKSMLEYLAKVVTANAWDDCSRTIAAQLSEYINGE